MGTLQISTIPLGAVLLAPFQAAQAQDVAYANESRPGYVIFFGNGPPHLTSVASETIQMAAKDAGTGPPASSALSAPLVTPLW
jgi:hypothetical protein